jgi:DNA-binding response OmpR family regulator
LLIAADWQFRALLRAQLVEEGFEVRSWPSLDTALLYLMRGGERLDAIVLDAESIEVESQNVSDLWRLAGTVPLLLCAGMSSRAELDPKDLPPATVLIRPFRVRDVVREVRKAVSQSSAE